MSENTQDMYMQWTHTMGASNASIFLIVGLAKGAINLIHFLTRLNQQKILSGGEVDDFAVFLKATKGDYNISRVPLKAKGDVSEDIERLKQAMDAAGVRYCMLPDFTGAEGEKSCYIAVYEKDQQKFAEVFMNHVKSELTGGSKNIDDLRNFTDGRTTVFSIPDETTAPMEKAMEKFRINFSMITADITPHHTQYLVPNSQLSRLQFVYKTLQEDMKKDGKIIGDSKVFKDPSEFTGKARMTNEEYIKKQMGDPKVSEAMEPLSHEISPDEAGLKSEMRKPGDSDTLACGQYFKNVNFIPLSIDDSSLVHDPKDRVLFDVQMKNPELFACRIPGTYGKDEEILLIPPEQVFKVDGAERSRYIAFIRKDEPPAVIKGGALRSGDPLYKTGEELYQNFDKQGKHHSYDPERLSELSKDEIREGWKGIEPKKKGNFTSQSSVKGSVKNSSRGFPSRNYDWDELEKKLLAQNGYNAADKGKDLVSKAPDIANSIPTKSLGL